MARSHILLGAGAEPAQVNVRRVTLSVSDLDPYPLLTSIHVVAQNPLTMAVWGLIGFGLVAGAVFILLA
jgi:hypothetical protein